MYLGSCASNANAAKASDPGHIARGHTVRVHIAQKSGACWLTWTQGYCLRYHSHGALWCDSWPIM